MFWLILFLLGLMVGSFVNVVIYRLPRGRTFITGRSQCPSCSREIPWYDLIPIVSFFILKSRCRQCRSKISWTYPAIELYSGLVFPLSFLLVRGGWANWLFSVVLLEIFLILAVIDLRHLILPDSLMLAALVVTVGYGLVDKYFLRSGLLAIFSINNLLAAILGFSVFFMIWFLSRGGWMGLGDAKLAGLIGFIFGLEGGMIVLYLSIILGALTGVGLLITKRAKLGTKLPLGSFFSFSSSLFILFGPVIIEKSSEIIWRIIS